MLSQGKAKVSKPAKEIHHAVVRLWLKKLNRLVNKPAVHREVHLSEINRRKRHAQPELGQAKPEVLLVWRGAWIVQSVLSEKLSQGCCRLWAFRLKPKAMRRLMNRLKGPQSFKIVGRRRLHNPNDPDHEPIVGNCKLDLGNLARKRQALETIFQGR